MDPLFEQEHPIPQQISAYEFHLVGDMTLKQFFQVAAGALISLVIYSSSFSSYVKWPLIFIFFLGGIAFAFFPLQDRPLSVWVLLFIKAIYSPTKYVWKKAAKPIQYFQPEPQAAAQAQQTQLPQPEDVDIPQAQGVNITFPTHPDKQQPATTPVQAAQTDKVTPFKLPDEEKIAQKKRIQKEIEIPHKEKTLVDHQDKEFAKDEASRKTATSTPVAPITPITGKAMQGGQQAQFSPEASPPTPPTIPNVIVGQVMDKSSNIIEGAILEIKDEGGRPVRALKTNKLGHFLIVTPLANGKYQILTEKEGYAFDPINLTTRGEIIQPIALKAKSNEQPSHGSVQTTNEQQQNEAIIK